MIIILYIIILGICIFFICDAFWANDKIIILGIGGSTLILYILLHFLVPITPAADYAHDFLGASFPVELILCATPSILILGIAGIIDTIKWKRKKRS